MSKLSTFIHIQNQKAILRKAVMENFARSKISHVIPDKPYLKMQYRLMTGRKLLLENPRTFNEKLQWLKLYNRIPEYTKLVDKYEVRNYISEKIGSRYLIPLIGVWECFSDIDFALFPQKFVIKCTHDSGGIIVCKDKESFEVESARRKIDHLLKRNFYYYAREWPYKNVHRRIIAEKYIVDDSTGELRDYKFFCFNGCCKCFKVDFNRFIEHRANYYDPKGHLLDFGEKICPPDSTKNIVLPENLAEMISLAEKLSVGFPFLRVDLYDVNGKIYFGELTFFPASGFGEFTSEEWDERLGSWIELPRMKC